MAEGFDTYAIDLSSRERTMRDIERVLTQAAARKPSARDDLPQLQIPTSLSAVDKLLRQRIDRGSTDEDEEGSMSVDQRWSTSGFRRGFGFHHHRELRGPTYDFWQSELLKEQCRIRSVYRA